MAKHKIKWLLFHEPAELFIRTAEDFQRHLDHLTDNKFEIEILTLADYQDKYLDGVVCDPFTELKEGRVQVSQIFSDILGDFDATDFYALSDVTMSDDIKTYRQALRDITKDAKPTLKDGVLGNVTFPTKPS